MKLKETLEAIEEAAKEENVDALQLFEQDQRVTIQRAAQEALDKID